MMLKHIKLTSPIPKVDEPITLQLDEKTRTVVSSMEYDEENPDRGPFAYMDVESLLSAEDCLKMAEMFQELGQHMLNWRSQAKALKG